MLDFFITGNVICDFSAAFIQTFIVYGWCLRNEKMKMTQISTFVDVSGVCCVCVCVGGGGGGMEYLLTIGKLISNHCSLTVAFRLLLCVFNSIQ